MTERKSQRQRRSNPIFSPDDYEPLPRLPRSKKSEARRRNVSSQNNHKWAVYVQRMRKLLQKLARYTHFVDVFTSQGWGSSKDEAPVQTMELERSQAHIEKTKQQIAELLREIASQNAHDTVWNLEPDEEGMVDVEQIACSKCGSGEATDDNDILLCDRAGCNRAYHQKCLDPPLETAVSESPDEDWFCWQCECLDDCLSLINSDLQTDYANWDEVFQDEKRWSHGRSSKLVTINGVGTFDLDESSEDDEDYVPGANDDDERRQGDNGDEEEGEDVSSLSENDDSGSGSSNSSSEGDSELSDEIELESVAESELAALSDVDLELDAADGDASIRSSDSSRARRRRRTQAAQAAASTIQFKAPTGPADIGRAVSRTKRGVLTGGTVTGFYVVAGVGPQSPDGSLSGQTIRNRGRWTVQLEDDTELELDFREMEAACRAQYDYEVACEEYSRRKEEEEKQRLLLDQGTIDAANVIEGKRRRGTVDYVLLNMQMFGSDVDEDALSEVDDFASGAGGGATRGGDKASSGMKMKTKKKTKRRSQDSSGELVLSRTDQAEVKAYKKMKKSPAVASTPPAKKARKSEAQQQQQQASTSKPKKSKKETTVGKLKPKSKQAEDDAFGSSDEAEEQHEVAQFSAKKKRRQPSEKLPPLEMLWQIERDMAAISDKIKPLRKELRALQARRRRLKARIAAGQDGQPAAASATAARGSGDGDGDDSDLRREEGTQTEAEAIARARKQISVDDISEVSDSDSSGADDEDEEDSESS